MAMVKHINDFLAGLPMTMIGGIFLILSFALPRAGFTLPVDPAWIPVCMSKHENGKPIVSGFP